MRACVILPHDQATYATFLGHGPKLFLLCFYDSGCELRDAGEKTKSKSDHRVDGHLRVRLHAMHVSRQLGPFSGGGRRCCARCGSRGGISYRAETTAKIPRFRTADAACQHYGNTAPRQRAYASISPASSGDSEARPLRTTAKTGILLVSAASAMSQLAWFTGCRNGYHDRKQSRKPWNNRAEGAIDLHGRATSHSCGIRNVIHDWLPSFVDRQPAGRSRILRNGAS